MNPAPKTIYSDLLSDIFSKTVKTKSEFKIQSWRRKTESLKTVNVFQYKLMSAILDTYINQNDKARLAAQSCLLLSNSKSDQAMVYRVIGNSYTHQGDYRNAMDAYWKAYTLTLDADYFYAFFNTGAIYDLYDERMNEVKSLSLKDQTYIKQEIDTVKNEIQNLANSKLCLDTYRDILSEAYTVFFTNCAGRITRYPSVSDSNVSTILFNPELDLETTGLLNDEMNNSLINLLEKYEYEELLMYPIIFTSENYTKNAEV